MPHRDPDTLHSFQIAGADIRPLWNGAFRLVCEGRSPFAEGDGASADAQSPTAPDALRALARDPVLATAAAILANPDSELECVIGGGSASFGHVSLYRHRDVDETEVIAVTPSVAGSYLLHCFDRVPAAARWLARTLSRIPDFVAWDVDTLSEVAATMELPRDLPEEMPLETLILLLHSIDAFRRATYHSLLRYEPLDGPVRIRAKEFDDTLRRSMLNGDVRWLLPAFHRLTPGLAAFEVAPAPEHFDLLTELDIVRPVRDRATQEALYELGEVGVRVGVEFYRTWHTAASFALWGRGATDPSTRAFLAPTAFANHLFALDRRDDGTGRVRHEPLREADLARYLTSVLDTPP